jgi:hypothetical protein
MQAKYTALFVQMMKPARAAAVITALGLMLCAQPSYAWVQAPKRILVTHDLGGPIIERMKRVERMRARGEGAAIPHGRCISACTLFLGLPETCIGPNVEFGFHGPSAASYGLGLPPDEFEEISRAMAQYYPAIIREWFLNSARYNTLTYVSVSGSELIRLGLPECT